MGLKKTLKYYILGESLKEIEVKFICEKAKEITAKNNKVKFFFINYFIFRSNKAM